MRAPVLRCIAAGSLLLAACAPAEEMVAEPSTLTVLVPGDESALRNDTPRFLLFVPLVARSENGELEGRLARSWEHSPDYRDWTVHLRTDVRWHDGVPVTADDSRLHVGAASPDRPARGEGLHGRGTGRQHLHDHVPPSWGEQAVVLVQSQLRRVGVRMEILTLDMRVGRDRWRGGDFDAAIVTNLTGEGGHLSLYGTGSFLGYASPTVAELLERAAASMNPAERDGIYRELWPIFQAELPITPLYPALWTYVVHRRVRGLSVPFRADPLWYAEELWLEDEG